MYYYYVVGDDRINDEQNVIAIFEREADAIRVIKDAAYYPYWKIKTNSLGQIYAEKYKPNPNIEKAVCVILRYKAVEMERGQCDDEPHFFKSYEDYDEYYN